MAEPDLSKIHGSRILLVEDNELNQQLATELLRQRNFVVDVALNGQEVLNVLRRQSYDLILMDVQMPVMDGYEAIREIRSNIAISQPRIIVVSANVQPHDVSNSYNAGADGFLPKPLDRKALMDIVNAIS